jgi:hypothetical protein
MHEHCWHGPENYIGLSMERVEFTCCHCGDRWTSPAGWIPFEPVASGHGNQLPEELRSSFGYHE